MERPYLELLDVAKHFGGVRALADVTLAVRRGSVHALVGENGAGKSTLGKIVAGVHGADGGRMLLGGQEVAFRSPREALEHKVAAIGQEPSLVPHFTVAQNVFLGVEPSDASFVRNRRLGRAYELAESAGFDLPRAIRREPADGRAAAGRDPSGAFARRAADRDGQPTAALGSRRDAPPPRDGSAPLRRGKTIILVSHFLREVLELADTVTVLRDGRLVKTSATGAETEASLVEAMLGRPLTSTFPPRRAPAADAPVVLGVADLHAPGVDGVSLEVRAGEIVGLAGLVGAGRTELARAVFGASRIESGAVVMAGGGRPGRSPRLSLRSGLAMIPESRKDDGLLFGRSSIENATLSRLGEYSTAGVVRRRAERRAGSDVLDRCGVRGASYSAVAALSAGTSRRSSSRGCCSASRGS
jgi:simple sugar transport system ATP-binding protein/ribose transport system ATP-binding protein